jgi:DNA polymerase-3 subunit epsilon
VKTIAIIDTETTDVDPAKGHLLEVACVLWSVEHRAVIESRSWLVAGAQENPAIAVNGISPELLREARAHSRLDVVAALSQLNARADALTAWNADFDRQWLSEFDECTWFDAMSDLEWPRAASSKKLVEVALAHGVGVVDAHRALTDCLTIARLLERVALDMDRIDQGRAEGGDPSPMPGSFATWLDRALRPKVHVEVADITYAPAKNETYKAHGFTWCPKPIGRWRRKMFVEDAEKLPFEVVEVR